MEEELIIWEDAIGTKHVMTPEQGEKFIANRPAPDYPVGFGIILGLAVIAVLLWIGGVITCHVVQSKEGGN